MQQRVAENQLPRSMATQRVDATAAEVKRLAQEELVPIADLLKQARRNTDKPPARDALTQVERHQKETEDSLKTLLEKLEPWSGAGEVRGESRSLLGEIHRQIEAIQQLQQAVPKTSIGKKRDDLPEPVKTELDRSAVRPERLAERIVQLLEKMERLSQEKEAAILAKKKQAADKQAQATQAPPAEAARLSEEARRDLSAAEAMQHEVDSLRQGITKGNDPTLRKQLKEVPAQVRNNQLGDAKTSTQAAAEQLERTIQALDDPTGTRGEPPDLLRKRVVEAGQRLDQLIRDEELLQKKIAEARANPDAEQRADELRKLAPEQERLQQEALELSRQFDQARNNQAALELKRSARRMDESRQKLEQGRDPENAPEQALERLDDAQDEIQQEREKAGEELARERLAKAAELIRALRDRQASALAERQRLQEIIIKEKKWPVPVAKSLPGLVDQQTSLAKEVRTLSEKRFESAPVFTRMLKQAAEAMDLAVKQLNARKDDVIDQLEGLARFDANLEEKADAATKAAQALALKRLDQLLESLKPDEETLKSNGPPPKGMKGEEGRPDGDALPPLAQLKALRSLQADLLERTAAFDKAHPDRVKLDADDLAELAELQKTQTEVADLVKDLTPMPGDAP